ncbi:MAG: putative DNA-binding domain-containing protein [Ignavibacteriales bacterium]|nr:putative DNA-binding domain-containing protein [Ignavibacteriales bacterium]
MNTHLHNYTYTQQSRLAGYCRTGELNSIDGLTENRVHHYRELVYNVVDDTLQSAFPLTFSLLSEDQWNEIVHVFFSTHECQSNSVWKMPYEFYLFVEQNDLDIKKKYNFIEELLLFEWTEIEIYMMPDVQYPVFKSYGGWLGEVIAINPEHKILQFNYPVHLKNPISITDDNRSEYYVLIFREKESGKVQFMNLSVYFAWLIEKI